MSIKLIFVVFQAMVIVTGNAGLQEPSDPERIDRFFEFTGSRFQARTPAPRVLVVSTPPAAPSDQSMYMASADFRGTPHDVKPAEEVVTR